MEENNDIFFVKFPKIYDNMGNFKFPSKLEWIATEKIDGSNFSVYSNGKDTKFAKRTGFLKPNEWFYNYQTISLDLSLKSNKIYNLIRAENKNLKFIVIYGELCGGFYPEDTKNWKGPIPSRINNKGVVIIPLEKRAIQEGVYYSNKINHIVFDIAIIDNENNIKYLEYDEMVSKCKKVDYFYTPILSKGTLKMMLDYSLEFNSTIPNLFGLKCIDNNKAEGIVIRPSIWKNNGEERPMLKRKNKNFTQYSGEFNKNEIKKNPFLVANCMINLNRLYGTISKIGPKAKKDDIVNLFIEDIWNSIWDIGIIVKNYDEVDNFIKKNVIDMVDEYIKNLNNK